MIPYRNRGGYVWVIYTYRREVCVARFDESGNAKATGRETSNRYRFSRFFVLNNVYRLIRRTYRQR